MINDIQKKLDTYPRKEKIQNRIIFNNNMPFTKRFYILKEMSKEQYKNDNAMRNQIANEENIYKVPIKGFSNYDPNWLGFDKDNNSYWFDSTNEKDGNVNTGKFIFQIYIYNQYGKLIKNFHTIGNGDLGGRLAIDDNGNVFLMQRWKKDGVKIYKYQRDW